MPGPSVNYGASRMIGMTVKGISAFLASPNSIVESDKVEVGGVQWHTVAKTFVENGTTYLAYYLRGTKDGSWRQWLNAQLRIRDCRYPYTPHINKSLFNELRISSAEHAYSEWGFDKFISKEGYLRNDELQLSLYFDCGIDIFSEESEAHHTNVKLRVQGQPVFVNKDLLSINSTVFERLFKEQAGTEIALQDTDLTGLLHFLRVIYPPYEQLNAETVKAVYQVAISYGADFLLAKCDEHVLESVEFPLIEKLTLADETKNKKLFDRLVRLMDKPSLTELAVNARVNVRLRGKAVESYFRQLPRSMFFDPPLALEKVLFVQDTNDEGLLAYMIGRLTKREMAHLKRVEYKRKFSKDTLMALFGKAHSLMP